MKESKQEKIKLIKDIAKGNVDSYLMSLGIVKALGETVILTQKDSKHFIEGVEVNINLIECNKAVMPDNGR